MTESRGLRGAMWLATFTAISGCPSPKASGPLGDSTSDSSATSTSVPISGRLVSAVAEPLIEALGSGSPVVLVLVRGSDCFTCEDLGRQLRELERLTPPDYRLAAVTNAEDLRRTEQFLMRERIGAAFLLGIESFTIFQSAETELPTPAVVMGMPTGTLTGVAHPVRVPNYRPKSFAEELLDLSKAATRQKLRP